MGIIEKIKTFIGGAVGGHPRYAKEVSPEEYKAYKEGYYDVRELKSAQELGKLTEHKGPRELSNEEARSIRQTIRREEAAKFDQKLRQATGTAKQIIAKMATKQTPYQVEGKTYYRTELRGRQPIPARYAQAIAGAVGKRLIKSTGKKYGRAGRPRGLSGRYIIPGKGAVGVYEYRKWNNYQRRLRYMQQQQTISEQMRRNPQLMAYYQQTGEIPQQVIEQAQNTQLQAQQQIIPPPISQYPPQQQSQGLSLMGGWEMMKIGMGFGRQQNNPQPINVFNVESPVTNPQGDWYTQADMAGRQVLKRRIGWETKW